MGVTSDSHSYVSESEDGTILLGFALGSPGCHSFFPVSALCLPFPKVPTQVPLSYLYFFFFPSLDPFTMLSDWASALEVPNPTVGLGLVP